MSNNVGLPAFALVLTGEKLLQLRGLNGRLGTLPAFWVTVISPLMAEKWVINGEPNYLPAALCDPSGVVAGGIDHRYADLDRDDDVARAFLVSQDEGEWVYAGIGVVAEKMGLSFEKQLTPVVVVDVLGRVRAGAGAITDLKEPLVAVVVVVSEDTDEVEEE